MHANAGTTMMSSHSQQCVGLSHLVEAATALTALVGQTNRCPPIQKPRAATTAHAVPPKQLQQLKQLNSQRSANPPAPQPQPERHSEQQPQQERSVVSDDDDDQQKGQANSSNSNKAAKKREIFPQRLMDIVSDASLHEIVSWLPHGRSFVIIRPDIFTDQVLPKYLPPVDARASTKYPSFTRKLNRWGFRQSTRGPDTGAFYHPLFRRDKPELCMDMVCQKSRDRKDQHPQQQQQRQRNLPPKKRVVHESNSSSDDEADCSNSTGESNSGNDSTTSMSPAFSTQQQVASPVLLKTQQQQPQQGQKEASTNTKTSTQNMEAVVSRKGEIGLTPYISNDMSFVATVLRQRDADEAARAAKAMLYEAFMEAMHGSKK